MGFMLPVPQFTWPDASHEFDAPPLVNFPLRRASSENSMATKLGKRNSSKTTARVRASGLSSSLKAARDTSPSLPRSRSTGFRSRGRKELYHTASAPASPFGSRPSSPAPLEGGPLFDALDLNRAVAQVFGTSSLSRGTDPQFICTATRISLLSHMAFATEAAAKANAKPTAVLLDDALLQHACVCGDVQQHPEAPARLQAVLVELTCVLRNCTLISARDITDKEVLAVHSHQHAVLQPTTVTWPFLTCGDVGVDSMTPHTLTAARLAAGGVVDLALNVARGKCKNGAALVRPPGLHATYDQPFGGCYLNNVALAARAVLAQTSLHRILVVDWDLHHGNGLQKAFLADPSVLHISLHHHDQGMVFPGTGALQDVGVGPGAGFNINIPWCSQKVGDAEYLAAFRAIVLPIAQQFNPELILVAAGFGAAQAPFNISPAAFGVMTQMLMTLADGRLVMVVEGGNDIPPLVACVTQCLHTLMGWLALLVPFTSGVFDLSLYWAPLLTLLLIPLGRHRAKPTAASATCNYSLCGCRGHHDASHTDAPTFLALVGSYSRVLQVLLS